MLLKSTLQPIERAVSRFNKWQVLAVLYLLAATVNVLVGLYFRYANDYSQLEEDEKEYFRSATDLIYGYFEPNGRRTIGYPLLLALVRSIAPSLTGTQIAISLVYAFSVPLTFAAVRKVSRSNFVGILAALVLLVWPPALFYGNSLYSESVALPCAVLLLAALPAGDRRVAEKSNIRGYSFMLGGAALALATHIRPMYMLFLPILLAIIAWEAKDVKRILPRIALTVIGFGVLILPWSIYVSTKLGTPIFVSAGAGETLAGGLNPNLLKPQGQDTQALSDRLVWRGPGKWITPEETGFLSPDELKLPYSQWSALLKDRAIAWALANPLDAAYIQMRKFTYMWGIYPMLANGKRQVLFGNIPTLLLLGLTFTFILKFPKLASNYLRFMLLPVFVTAVAMISWGSWRFRMIGDVGLIAFCAITFCHWAGLVVQGTPTGQHALGRRSSDHRHAAVDV